MCVYVSVCVWCSNACKVKYLQLPVTGSGDNFVNQFCAPKKMRRKMRKYPNPSPIMRVCGFSFNAQSIQTLFGIKQKASTEHIDGVLLMLSQSANKAMCRRVRTFSFTHSLSFAHSLTHSLIHSFIHSFIHSVSSLKQKTAIMCCS